MNKEELFKELEIIRNKMDNTLEYASKIDKNIRSYWKENNICPCCKKLLESEVINCKHVNKVIDIFLENENKNCKKSLFDIINITNKIMEEE